MPTALPVNRQIYRVEIEYIFTRLTLRRQLHHCQLRHHCSLATSDHRKTDVMLKKPDKPKLPQ